MLLLVHRCYWELVWMEGLLTKNNGESLKRLGTFQGLVHLRDVCPTVYVIKRTFKLIEVQIVNQPKGRETGGWGCEPLRTTQFTVAFISVTGILKHDSCCCDKLNVNNMKKVIVKQSTGRRKESWSSRRRAELSRAAASRACRSCCWWLD